MLFAAFLGVVGLLVVLIVFLMATGLREHLAEVHRNHLLRDLALARMVVQEAGPVDPDSLAGAITRRIGYRTTIIAPDGRVLGDSDVTGAELPEVESHAGRPEIQGALEGEPSFAERTSTTVGTPLLYGAAPATLGGEPVVIRLAAPLAELEATVRRSQRDVAAVGLIAMMVALLVAYLLSRAFTRPLVALAERAGRMGAGDFSRLAPRHSAVAELDELALAFNRLSEELQHRLQELGREKDEMHALIDSMAEGVVALTDDARVLRTNRAAREFLAIPAPPVFAPVGTVVRQPELRDLMEEAVAHSVEAREIVLGERHLIVTSRMLDEGGAVVTFLDVSEIRRLEQVRRDFAANVSHELKTPLTSIRGFAETLLEDDPPPDLKQRFLESIRANTVRLQHLVDDLLDLSRLESGGWVARREEVDLVAAVESVWEDFLPGARQRDVHFSVEGEGVVVADEQGLFQVFQNLFENALRYVGDGGHIGVTITPRGGLLEIAVSDDGAGIPSRALPRIFERFYRADSARARTGGGTGLGLAIVRHLVSAMDGEVEAKSELGRGTTLYVRLPAVV